MLRVARVRSQEEFDALEPAWTDLLESSANPSVFLSWNWVKCWLDEYGPESESFVMTVRNDDGELCGIAPLAVTRDSSWHRLKRMTIIGQQPTYGEYLDVISRRGDEAAVATAVVDQICRPLSGNWDVLVILRMLAESATLPHLQAAFSDHGATCRVEAKPPSPTTRLAGDFDELLASRSGNFRQQFRNATNRLERLGKVQVLVAPADVPIDTAFEEMIRLHHLRWDRKGGFTTEDRVRFNRAFSHRLAENDQLFLALMTVDGQTIAARYDFVFAGKMWCVQGGWDPEYRSIRPGTLMTGETIRWAIEHGLTEYDFLAGMHDYKLRWANDQRELVALTVANPRTIRGRAYGRLRKL
jgi:CelD/BcsL family acetyltransferase involved in cellulose biosynthesis